MLLSEAFEAYIIDELESENRAQSTIDNYHKALSSFLASNGEDMPIQLISYLHIIRWKKDLHDTGLASSYVAHHLMKFRSVLTYLKKHGFACLDPSEVKIPSFKYRKTPWLTIDEIQQLFRVIESKRDRALFACQFSSGARISEILSLDRDSIVDGSAKIWGKGKKEEDDPDTLEFDMNALRVLDEYLLTRKDDMKPLFISRQNRRLGVTSAIYLINGYAEKAGIKRYNNDGTPRKIATHVLRHSFSTDLFLKGADIYRVSQQLRHSSIDVTARHYIHPTQSQKTEDFRKFHTPTPV